MAVDTKQEKEKKAKQAPVIIVGPERLLGKQKTHKLPIDQVPEDAIRRPYRGRWVYLLQPRSPSELKENPSLKPYIDCPLLDLRNEGEDKLMPGKLFRARHWIWLQMYNTPLQPNWQKRLETGLIIGIVLAFLMFIFLMASSIG